MKKKLGSLVLCVVFVVVSCFGCIQVQKVKDWYNGNVCANANEVMAIKAEIQAMLSGLQVVYPIVVATVKVLPDNADVQKWTPIVDAALDTLGKLVLLPCPTQTDLTTATTVTDQAQVAETNVSNMVKLGLKQYKLMHP